MVWMQKQSPPIAEWPALSFLGGTAQIRRTPEGTGVNPLEKPCDRQNHASENDAGGAEFSCSTARNISSGVLRRAWSETLLNVAVVATSAGHSGKLPLRT